MKTALLFLCGLVFLGLGLGAWTTSAHNVQRRSSSPTENITVLLYMQVDAVEPWTLSVGDTVQIKCLMYSFPDSERVKQLKLHLSQIEESAVMTMTTEPIPNGISYTLSPVSLSDRGLYRCHASNSDPHIDVMDAYKLIWVNDTFPLVSLKLLSVNRVQYFYDKTFTVGCQMPDDDSKWRIFRASGKPDGMVYEECPNQTQSGRLVSCDIPHLPFPVSRSRRYDPYWCQSSPGRKSNVLNMTQEEFAERDSRDLVVTKYDLTSAWYVREGDSVGFLCNVRYDRKNNKDKFDLQLIWTKLDPENSMTVLLSQRASIPINYTLTNIKHEHAGVYSCWDDGTLSNILLLAWHHFIWVHDDSPPITINVLSHNRTMFFNQEAMTVGCQLPNDQSQWKLKRFDKWTGVIKECEESELSSSRLLSCSMNMGYPWTDFLFWCESTTGLKSNVLNVTNTVGGKVLEVPSLVMEGDDITLRCLQKDKTTGIISVAPAFFKFNGITFEWSDAGVHTIKNVTTTNEGFYSCRPKNDVESLKTFVTVKGTTNTGDGTDLHLDPRPSRLDHQKHLLG